MTHSGGRNEKAKLINNRSPRKSQTSFSLKDQDGLSIQSAILFKLALLTVAILSIITRFYDIHKPAHVCWDETHFGKMASWYINRTFFFDVHPPLGKMMIALSGHLSGYDGRFAFDKPGDQYEHWTQYVGMRLFCAALGLIIPSFIFIATHSMTKSVHSATLAALLVVFDNGMITLTRYILLDPPLLFFIASSILGLAQFSFKLKPISQDSFSFWWWFWLTWTGVSIACAFSVKFVGLFIVALVGLRTIYDIWVLLGDISRPFSYFLKHLFARVLCLIVLPIVIYVTLFWLHLNRLNHTGNGDGFYSSSFQSQLIGNSLHNSSWPAHLAYGAEVTIKNNRIGGAYLHSHWHLYPEGIGAKQQQVTTYSHKDSNNKWLVKRALINNDKGNDIYVHDGDLIMLEHITTKRNLHSHFETAPITKRHYQVTCYGENGLGDANDIWKIQKVSGSGVGASRDDQDDRIFTVKTKFKLVHYLTNCALHSHPKHLPKWGYEQLEVTCNPKLYDKNNYWNIEDNDFKELDYVSFEEYAPTFLEKFIEAHAVMLQGNAGLKPKEGEETSRPWQWPINYRGQFFSASKEHRIYLLGNPIIWWFNIAAIPISLTLIVCLAILSRITDENVSIQEERIESNYLEASVWSFLGWALHYIPFFFMGRVLYFHHYFPAFLFSCMLTAMTYDYILSKLIQKTNYICNLNYKKSKLFITSMLITIVIYTFTIFIPLTYGTKTLISDSNNSTTESWRKEQQLSSLKWLDSWEF